MKQYTCIVCPNGCSLTYDEVNHKCTGNKCPRGAKYAEEEFTCPMRTVCSSIRTTLPEYPVISVRTSKEIPKKMMFDVIKEINKAVVKDYLPIDSIVIKNVLGTGVDIITTTQMSKGETK